MHMHAQYRVGDSQRSPRMLGAAAEVAMACSTACFFSVHSLLGSVSLSPTTHAHARHVSATAGVATQQRTTAARSCDARIQQKLGHAGVAHHCTHAPASRVARRSL